ncbi:MAG: glycine cleavage system protein GcvH [Micavibrio sp.]|jgi:glycine cleavage system H protein|nr:MAG: glycine cleavage system protein GcvH [Micavibrio sp.]
MSTLYFTEEHEYILVDDNGIGTVGISDYAQQQLGDVVYVEMPETGTAVESGDEAGVVESVKIASEIYAPVSGEVVEINDALTENPALVNDDPMGDGWFFKIKITDEAELEDLKDEAEYLEFLEELAA